jgi:chaperonin GroES
VPDCPLKPLEYNVVIVPDEVETRTPGGIILPDEHTDKLKQAAQRGTIAAMSPHAFSYAEWPGDASPPAVGAKVLFGRYAGSLIDQGGTKYRVVKDKDIIAEVEAA